MQTAPDAPVLLDLATQPRFVHPLPMPPVIDAAATPYLVLQMRQSEQWLGLVDEAGKPLLTTVWGFGTPDGPVTTPGPTILARSDQPMQVLWENALPVAGHLLPIDDSIHMAMPTETTLEDGYVPTVVHLHGGHNLSESDGLPEAWFTQDFAETGRQFATELYDYPNDQPAATLWYHDHVLGLTRIHAGSGLVGMVLLQDATEAALVQAGVLPEAETALPLILQDRAFTADGQLYLPAFPDDPMPGGEGTVADELPPDYAGPLPSVLPEFFGDVPLVNGMAWPMQAVGPGQYLLHLLNASDSRFYVLRFDDPSVKAMLVGTDGGLLPKAVTVMDGDGVQQAGEQIVLAPADRVDLVVDFSHAAGHAVTLENVGPAFAPFVGLNPDGSLASGEGEEIETATGTSMGALMRFDVASCGPAPAASVEDGTVLDPHFADLSQALPDRIRQLGLFETEDDFGRPMPQLGLAEAGTDIGGNPVPFGPLGWDAPVTEVIHRGATEMWRIANFTDDAHPVHLHLVEFQLLARNAIDFADGGDGGDDVQPDGIPDGGAWSLGEALPIAPEDTGRQDTIWVGAHQSVDIVAHFDRAGEFVWHCHILSHEDNEMMRPYVVTDDPWQA
ncbi:multicopper oxidase family protein [Paracraurococcus lichenis]|uniref:Multicopper oxidase domain-containing protein n=1 Tax=Paracraurococcus lichenis TaxID=3064888 RepID=A0ABT9DW83_9PROT|nr:multicopper oxidase domain-containing protein [Paracraurococcus sp. LOR1-02]MDO9708152.1 multicopper oxidase domain-containing protein [Paracraurococcus sp. LOR1-02]